jgi:S1-C subfamily serine protease
LRRNHPILTAVSAFLILGLGSGLGFGQFKTDLVNSDGATGPCVGIGPIGGPAARKCADMLVDAGFLRIADVGVSGLTVGTTGNGDGVISAIAPGSPAEQAGFAAGDSIVAVDGVPARRTPGSIAAQRTFGPRGEELNMTVQRNGKDIPVKLVRAPQTAPPGPKTPNMFVMVRSVVDWRGRFVPCMGIGPAAPAAFALCHSRFKPYGYVTLGDFGTTGVQIDTDRKDGAVITAVDPNGPAAKADVQPGDKIVAVEGKPLTASLGENTNSLLFGKAGDVKQVTVRRGGVEKKLQLTLAAKPKE